MFIPTFLDMTSAGEQECESENGLNGTETD